MLCIKNLVADKMAMPTIIFDEIDTGISGEIAFKVASMMKNLAQKHQVIAISHLPQIAAKGDAHFFVYKEDNEQNTVSKVKELTAEQRITEIARMINGNVLSQSAIDNAKELLGR